MGYRFRNWPGAGKKMNFPLDAWSSVIIPVMIGSLSLPPGSFAEMYGAVSTGAYRRAAVRLVSQSVFLHGSKMLWPSFLATSRPFLNAEQCVAPDRAAILVLCD